MKIRDIPREAWKKKEWPITADLEDVKVPLIPSEMDLPEEHEPEPESEPIQERIRFPYKEDDE